MFIARPSFQLGGYGKYSYEMKASIDNTRGPKMSKKSKTRRSWGKNRRCICDSSDTGVEMEVGSRQFSQLPHLVLQPNSLMYKRLT